MSIWKIVTAVAALSVATLPTAAAEPTAATTSAGWAPSQQDLDALGKTSDGIRAAYASGETARIMAFHHPDVIKVLSYNKSLIGYAAVEEDVALTLQAQNREFVEQKIESILYLNGAAVQQALYTIKVTPRNGGEPFLARGRSMVVYVRYPKSPTGWAIVRGFIQPATKSTTPVEHHIRRAGSCKELID